MVPEAGVGLMRIRLENRKKNIDTATNMKPSIRYMTSESTRADKILTIPQMTAVGIRNGSMIFHLIESLYFTEIKIVLMLTMTMESPIALL